jgi:hypothetical protein
VKRLVKSVVRGLKVRGLQLWPPLTVHIAVDSAAGGCPGFESTQPHALNSIIPQACQDPERGREGLGGSYVCYNEGGGRVAIFKPCDEEPLAPNNPKGYVGRMLGDPGWKPTVRVGEVRGVPHAAGVSALRRLQATLAPRERLAHPRRRAECAPPCPAINLPACSPTLPQAALREVAAYLLDHGHFARVPHTTLVRASHPAFHYAHTAHLLEAAPAGCDGPGAGGEEEAAPAPDAAAGGLPPKLGSLQEFVTHLFDTSELGTSRLSKRDIHRIGILDVSTEGFGGLRPQRAIQPEAAAWLGGW